MPDDPFTNILGQLGDLLKLIEKNANKPLKTSIDPSVEKELIRIDGMINHLNEIADDELRKLGKKDTTLYQRLEKHPENYTETEKKLIRRCTDLGLNAVVLRVGLIRAMKETGYSKNRQVGKNTKKSIQKRRNKFKGMDGGQSWKKL